MTKVVVFLRTKRWFESARYWFVDGVVRAEGTGDIQVQRDAKLPEDATDEDLAKEIATWYGVAENEFELGDPEDLNNEAPIRSTDSPASLPVRKGESVRLDPQEELAKARNEG